MNSTGLLYPTYSWFSLSALKVSSCKCKLPLFLVFWDRQNKSVWLAKLLILYAHENVGGIRSFVQIWLHSPETKLSFKNLMKCLALLVAKITILQFAFCRGYLVSKPEKLQLNQSFLYLSEMGTRCKTMCQGCWCATDLETEKNFTEERLSEGLSRLDGGSRWVLPSPASSPLPVAHCHCSPAVSSPSLSFHGSFVSPDEHCFRFLCGFMHPGHKYDNN